MENLNPIWGFLKLRLNETTVNAAPIPKIVDRRKLVELP